LVTSMRTVKIENCKYEKFQAVRSVLWQSIPFGLISENYDKEMSMAIFRFWDLAYVPDALKEYVMEPPNNAAMEKCNAAMDKIKKSNW